jgi:hypothetical protein
MSISLVVTIGAGSPGRRLVDFGGLSPAAFADACRTWAVVHATHASPLVLLSGGLGLASTTFGRDGE